MCRMKLRELSALKVDCLVLACPSCTMQYEIQQANFARAGEIYNVPVMNYTELLGLALGLRAGGIGTARASRGYQPVFRALDGIAPRTGDAGGTFRFEGTGRVRECNGCRNDCPVNLGDPTWVPNEVINRLASGDLDGVIASKDVWKCHECYTCADRCCQSYSMLEIFRSVKRLSVERGVVPAGVADGIAAVRGTGAMIAGSEAARKRLKLPATAPSGAAELAAILSEQ